MTAFRYMAYAAPLAVGFGVAGALALAGGKSRACRFAAALGVLLGVLAVLAAASFTEEESFRVFLPVAVLLAALAAFVAGVFVFFASLGCAPAVCQVAAGLAVAALMSTVFCFGPVLERAQETGMPGDELSRHLTFALDVNPFMAMGYSVFHHELLLSPSLYRLGLADYPHAAPVWQRTAAGYAAAGTILLAAALGVFALRRRLQGAAS